MSVPDVAIDILPNEDPNNVNTNKGNGNVSVAIIGNSVMQESDYDVGSFAFGPNSAAAFYYESKDFNGDGIDDLITYYYITDTGLASSDTSACLTGDASLSSGGFHFNACDSIHVTNQNDD